MKKILIINGSIRKKATFSLLKSIESLLGDYEVTFLNIKDFDIKPCIGCENCMREGTCNIKDEANIVLTKISDSDGVIIGSPVYLRQISGYLKVLIDRGCVWYHRSPLVGKPVFFVTATQVTGSSAAVRYLNDLSVQWGTINAGHISRNMFNLEKSIESSSLDNFKYYLEDENKRNYKPTIKQIIEFNTQKVLGVNILPLDMEYWEEKGYVGKPYFYDCKINVFKRLIGGAYYKMLTYFIVKNKR
ncbi:flavodoxin family protein [Gudongella sp. DL1XJH-153]|uniref:flavodoxin family protein n=1 Tax=Gudongella sp. DL1XJH-153 TaxID=3409804 RepID=UPI003BB6A87D